MAEKKYFILAISCFLFFGVGIVFGRIFQFETLPTSTTLTSEEDTKETVGFFYYQIPEIGMQFSMPEPLRNHVTHVYRERSDRSWATNKELTPEQIYGGAEFCISRGEKIKEIIFQYDQPFYFGDDERGYTELGSLTEVRSMDSDDCGTGKIGPSYFVKKYPDNKLYKYTSIWNGMGSFIMNIEKEPELEPLFFMFDAYVGPSLNKMESL